MNRLTKRELLAGHHVAFVSGEDCFDVWSVPKKFMGNAIDRLATIEDILGDTYDLDHLRELVEADKDGRCMVLPFKPHKTMWSCSKSNPKPAKAYYATEMGILADMKAGCVFGETPEAAEAALAKEDTP